MPTFQFEAMDATGNEIRDVIEAATEDEAQQTIRSMGYFITKISVKKGRAGPADKSKKGQGGRTFAIGGASSKDITTFTRQLSILQDAGLPILRSLRILQDQCKPGALRNALIDTCEEIEGGNTLSEAFGKSPKVFNRLYVNMIKAGEAGGALELILNRLADFMERSESLRKQVKAALIYPVMVVCVAVGILTFIMLKIVPEFEKMFSEFDFALPTMTVLLMTISKKVVMYWYLIPLIPLAIYLAILILRKFKFGRAGWDQFILKIPIFGKLVEKNIMARTVRTLGTLVASGVPILEGLTITRETSSNMVFENLYGKVSESIREGETIAGPLKKYSRPAFHPVTLILWMLLAGGPIFGGLLIAQMVQDGWYIALACSAMGALFYVMKLKDRVVDPLVVNMVDVGEETGELDTMLYKVADVFDDEVETLTNGLMKLIEPLLMIFLGGAVGFIVIALFLPLVELIKNLS